MSTSKVVLGLFITVLGYQGYQDIYSVHQCHPAGHKIRGTKRPEFYTAPESTESLTDDLKVPSWFRVNSLLNI